LPLLQEGLLGYAAEMAVAEGTVEAQYYRAAHCRKTIESLIFSANTMALLQSMLIQVGALLQSLLRIWSTKEKSGGARPHVSQVPIVRMLHCSATERATGFM
jgi:hypothetical protein